MNHNSQPQPASGAASAQAANGLTTLTSPALLKRLAALTYDTLVLIGISIVYGMIGFALKELFFGVVPKGTMPKGGPLLFIGWMLLLVGFYLFFWKRAGQTVGMRAWRLKLISTTGKELSVLQLLLRCLIAVIGFLALGLGYFWVLFDKENSSLHDRLSRTRMIVLPKQ